MLFLSSFRGSLEGKREQKSYKALLEDPMLRFSGLYQENCSDLYVTCQVFAEGKPLALPVRTSYRAFSTRWKWVPTQLAYCYYHSHFNLSDLVLLKYHSPIRCHRSPSSSIPHFSCCLQLEWVAAAASQVPRPSTECPGCSHSLGHIWARQSCSCWGNHCYTLWQIWVSLT